MKKMIIGLCLGSGLLFAQEQYFIGVGLGHGDFYVDSDVAIEGNGIKHVSFKDGGGLASIHGGIIINEKHKIFLEYATFNTSNNVDAHQTDIGYEYYLNETLELKQSKFNPFIGARYSIVNYKETLINNQNVTWNSDEFDLTHYSTSLDIGFDYNIASNQFLEFTYSYELSSSDTYSTTSGTYSNGDRFSLNNIEISNLNEYVISYNYKF